ncbi:hypothetical protein ODJ79_03215 [Actinoplanes sp. KI2]|uniref:hypothetical protein n=1 Tax=Actinoplanes sp. KI2 TaxID=2983315 RepID=UPI0021D5A581|nr:hypothetical protein [Actinoplanes sp. KI2]MCU7722716.1 hypothetical protein [Actinoplanes sp. KI2]
MHAPLIASAVVTAAYLVGYLALSLAYDRRLDARLRAALGRRLGADVAWTHHAGWADPFSDATSAAYEGWGTDAGPVKRLVVSVAHLAVIVLLGVGPIVVYLLATFAGLLHPLVAWVALFLLLPIFGLFWAGRFRPRSGRP